MKIEIDDDYADAIVVGNLADSYNGIKEMLTWPNNHEDDIAAWKELLPAMELVGNWYAIDFKAAIKAAKKAKKK
jgi:hypothetical protein